MVSLFSLRPVSLALAGVEVRETVRAHLGCVVVGTCMHAPEMLPGRKCVRSSVSRLGPEHLLHADTQGLPKMPGGLT